MGTTEDSRRAAADFDSDRLEALLVVASAAVTVVGVAVDVASEGVFVAVSLVPTLAWRLTYAMVRRSLEQKVGPTGHSAEMSMDEMRGRQVVGPRHAWTRQSPEKRSHSLEVLPRTA